MDIIIDKSHGLLCGLSSFLWEDTIPLAHPDKFDAMNLKVAGVIILIIPLGIAFGMSIGTGMSHGGKRFKGFGGIRSQAGFL